MKDLTQIDNVVAYMKESLSEKDWNDRSDKVKEANGNEYPGFWFMEIVMSGLTYDTALKWKYK